ncbi:hypothetical protein QO010_001858 [Caulobacter ginsengisoli]|uniref:Holin n=1 Tax=Caulobacter ginsengisoli TaxID=400775 RepID=A0ABU0ISZ2_9CAUL|nr:hypothetical protein [Caulobacter ginsengisoli]MDQ0464087.1 hypothetical protein [Caulobacter ginsengisoli]
MNYRIWSARAAVCFGPLVVAQVVARNWGAWEPWAYWVDDMVAAALLIAGGAFAMAADTTTNSRALTGAWGFTLATLWVSMIRMMETTAIEAPTPIWLITLTLILFLGSIAGGVGSLPSKRVAAISKPAARPKPRSSGGGKSRSRSKAS